MANAMCIVANKGYFYIPHFVQKVEGHSADDSVLDKYSVKHEVLTHISDADYETVISGMQDVTEVGTARIARIDGINMCAKTGTAENYLTLEGKRTKLNNNSMFVCFAPRENPQIAVAVVIQNAGFGATWAGRIGSLLVEKYLRDTLTAVRVKLATDIANTNLMPGYFVRLQFITDSVQGCSLGQTNRRQHTLEKISRILPSAGKCWIPCTRRFSTCDHSFRSENTGRKRSVTDSSRLRRSDSAIDQKNGYYVEIQKNNY